MDNIEKAREYAYEKHNKPSESQRYGNAPYSKHLNDVKTVADRHIHYLDPEEIEDVYCAIYLHDTVEDTETTPNLLKKMFNDRIAGIVLAVSNERGWDKKEILFKTLPKIWQNKLATFVKLCDRIANTTNSKAGIDAKSSSLYERYKTEYPVFRYALKDANFENMWAELDELYEYNVGDYCKKYESTD
jgi:guanosine-3',5'-bis(diphosphate) 3'-pyrophosphohydrolase